MIQMLLWTVAAASFAASLAATALANALLDERIAIAGSFLGFERSFNPGIAFSVTFPPAVQLALIAAAFVCVVVFAFRSPRSRLHAWGFGLVIGGALGNLADRLGDGMVTDYVQAGSFPVFNAADSFITIGVGLLLLRALLDARKAG